MAVTHGNDPEVLEAIGDALRAEADRARGISSQGAGGIAVLVDAWAGADLEVFGENWRGAQQQLESAALLLRAVGDRATEQADQQRTASGEGGSSSPFGIGAGVGLGLGVAAGADAMRPPSDTFTLPDDYEDGPEIPFRNKGQVPQGLAYDAAHDELVYTFYDEDDDTDGEIVFVDRETGEVTSRVPLRGQDHYGGVYVDGEYTYVSGGGDTQVYRTEDLRNPEVIETPDLNLPFGATLPDIVSPAEPIDTIDTKAHSTVTVHDGHLYVTQFTKDENDPGNMYKYEIGDDGSPTGDPVATYQVPPQTQGVSFDEAGNAYYSSSYGRGNESTLTRVSAEDFARDGGWTSDNGDARTIPNMAEGSVIVDGQLYQLYESGADKYDGYPGPDFIGNTFSGKTDPRDHLTVHDLRN